MWADAAGLMRQMDAMLADTRMDVREKVFALIRLSQQVWDAVREYAPGERWPGVNTALGPQPLRFEREINDLLDIGASGAFPDWSTALLYSYRVNLRPCLPSQGNDIQG